MARKRQIDPGIWTSDQFIELGHKFGDKGGYARQLFIGSFSCADDEGRIKASPTYLKSTIFPADAHSLEEIKLWRDAAKDLGLCQIYSVNSIEYMFLPTFLDHQYMTKRFKSKLPPPEVNNRLITDHQQVNNRLHGIGTDNDIDIGNENGESITGYELVNDITVDGGELIPAFEIWESVLEELKRRVSKGNYESYLKDTVGLGCRNTTFIVGVKSTVVSDSLTGRLEPMVKKVLGEIIRQNFSVGCEVFNQEVEA